MQLLRGYSCCSRSRWPVVASKDGYSCARPGLVTGLLGVALAACFVTVQDTTPGFGGVWQGCMYLSCTTTRVPAAAGMCAVWRVEPPFLLLLLLVGCCC
jgi:hypothetical protein